MFPFSYIYIYIFIVYIISQALRAEISGFLEQLQFEVTRKDFNAALLRFEMHLSTSLENQAQVAK